MVFSSMTFLTLFLPLVLMGYYVCFLPVFGKRWPSTHRVQANLFLLAASLFLFLGEGWRVWVLAASCVGNFLLARLMMWRVTISRQKEERMERIFEARKNFIRTGRAKKSKMIAGGRYCSQPRVDPGNVTGKYKIGKIEIRATPSSQQ